MYLLEIDVNQFKNQIIYSCKKIKNRNLMQRKNNLKSIH